MTGLVWLNCAIQLRWICYFSHYSFQQIKKQKNLGNPEALDNGERQFHSLMASCAACLLTLLIGFEVRLQ